MYNLSLPQVRNLLIIYIVSALIAVLIVVVLLDPIKLDKEVSAEDRRLNPRLLVSTAKHLVHSPTQILLVPLTIYSGVEQAFIGGDFTQVGLLPFHCICCICIGIVLCYV
jgi:cytosine/uracil/thiamine/allantoin permease